MGGKNRENGQQNEVDQIIRDYQDDLNEVSKSVKSAQRLKRKSISLFLPSMRRSEKRSKWGLNDLERDMVKKEKQMEESKELKKKPIREEDPDSDMDEPKSPEKSSSKTLSLAEEVAAMENLSDICSLEQRFSNLETNPTTTNKLYPIPIKLLTKRSRRCRTCKKYVVKPESSVVANQPFKMNNLMIQYVPKVRIRTFEGILPAELQSSTTVGPGSIVLALYNPTQSECKVKLTPAKHIDVGNNVVLGFESIEVTLGAFDTILEENLILGDHDDGEKYKDDPKIVASREGHVLAIYVPMSVVDYEMEAQFA
eukprot:CAMPEP_0115015216 /NCGR_PEP_ID=MMETSP0216-20121206/26611_1 /TAXON_ID=223996 /ORGANISM="Protocruzia adherens, Strain Boccale" /LENGTH=310 /DNA_ID=CAMNT_0002385243 /DNA_START=283 /DNA_END=1212 /DNA_ORIENTATION=-